MRALAFLVIFLTVAVFASMLLMLVPPSHLIRVLPAATAAAIAVTLGIWWFGEGRRVR